MMTNPFPGLRPFLSHEKHLFFGRERQIAELVDRLSAARFLAVVGTSGSGKSSLVRAGLLPELYGGNLVSAGSRWEVIVLRPGNGPIHNLAAAFIEGNLYDPEAPDALNALVATLNHSRFGLIEAVRQSDLPPATNLLVIVDQFEEIFRFHNQLASGDEHAVDFVNLLLEATRQDDLPIYVALTMRSDFLGDCAQFNGLAEAVNKGEYLIPRMNRDQCRLAIEGPVRVGGAAIAPRLTTRLLNEIGDSPDQLPVLQHALMRTWERWEGDGGRRPEARDRKTEARSQKPETGGRKPEAGDRKPETGGPKAETADRGPRTAEQSAEGGELLTAEASAASSSDPGPPLSGLRPPSSGLRPPLPLDLADYEAVGTMTEALSRHADEVFLGLNDDRQRKVAERLFKALTERGTEGRGVRRPVRIERLAEILDAPTQEVLPVIEAFRAPGRTFLMPMLPTVLSPATIVDISHESLMRVWQRLRTWTDEEAQSARIYRRLAETATLQTQGRAGLYRDPDLQIALAWRDQEMPTAAWAERYHAGFSTACAFLNASSEAARAEEAARELARQHELDQARALAESERQRAAAQALHASRLRMLVRGLGVALMVAITASVIALLARDSARLNERAAVVKEQIARESEARAKAATRKANALQFEASKQAYASSMNLAQSLIEAGRHRDADQLLSRPVPGELRGWEFDYLASQLAASGLPLDETQPGRDSTWGLDFSPDSKRIAYAHEGRELRIRNLETGALDLSVDLVARYGPGQAFQLRFSPDGSQIAIAWITAGAGTNAWLLDAFSGATLRGFTVDFLVACVDFNPRGDLLALGGLPPDVLILETKSGAVARRLPGHAGAVNGLRFTPDGQRLITVTGRWGPQGDNTEAIARVWDVASGQKLREMTRHTDWIRSLAIHPKAPLVATGARDGMGRVRMWNYETGAEVYTLPSYALVAGLALSPDASLLFMSHQHGFIGAFDAADGRPIAEWKPHDNWIHAMAISPNGRFLATHGFDGILMLLDLEHRIGNAPLPAHRRPISALAASPDGSRIASGSWDQTVQIRTLAGWKLLASVPVGRVPTSLSFNPDGSQLLVPGRNGSVVLLASDSGRVVREFATGASRSVHEAFFSPDGRTVAILGIDGYVTVAAADTAKILWRRQAHVYLQDGYPDRLAHSIRFSPDSQRLVSVGATDFKLRVFDANSGDELAAMNEPNGARIAAFSPDGKLILSSSGARGYGYATVWDASTYTRLEGFQIADPAGTLLFSADGERLITTSGNWFDLSQASPVRLWDTSSRRPLITLGGSNTYTHAVWVPGTKLLIGANTTGSISVWDAPDNSIEALPNSPTNALLSQRLLAASLRPKSAPPLGIAELNIAARRPDGLAGIEVVRRGIPARSPTAPPGLLDLTPHAIASTEATAHLTPWSTAAESDLGWVPSGLQRINGVLFDIRGLIAVTSTNTPARPTSELITSSVKNIPVSRKFQRLHSLLLLWPSTRGMPDNPPVAQYRLRFSDGTEAVIPILRGRDVINAVATFLDTGPAFQNAFPVWNANDQFQRLCHAIFDNPRPDLEVRQIDLEAADTLDGAVIVSAITLETSPPVRFISQPRNQRVAPGASVEFKASLSAPDPVDYQWQVDNRDIPGATNATLRLETAGVDHVGRYSVTATLRGSGDIVRARSEAANLELIEPFGIRGQLRIDYYDNIPDKYLTNLTRHAKFPGSPDRTVAVPQFEIPRNLGDNYGTRITGFLLPPRTGDYRFYVASDDSSQLFLSSDDSPENKKFIAEETQWQSFRAWTAFRRRIGAPSTSQPIHLEAGKRYYIEGLFKEGNVHDHFAVTWQPPGERVPENGSPPIPGRYLAAPEFTPTQSVQP